MTHTRDILHSAGLRHTPVRSGVIEYLAKSHRPQSVQEILAALPDGTDVVTIYRTLNTLVERRLARRIRSDDRGWLFELSLANDHQHHVHAHFVCDNCGTVECLPDVEPLLPRNLKLEKGYQVTKQDLTLHGTCPKCH